MKIKVAEYIADFLVSKGVEHIFTVTGGGAMHLNDAFGHHNKLCCIYNHHEQACSMAAEGYARLSGKIAAVCVTTGPGGTNAITGVVGGWQDSIPMFVISGQVKRETTTWSTNIPLRQLGDQEFQIIDCVKGMTKYAHMVTEANEIRYHLEKAWYLSQSGRKGPVWIDIPIDIQASIIETEGLLGYNYRDDEQQQQPIYDTKITLKIIEKIKASKRPVVYAGSGVWLSKSYEEFRKCIELLNIPVVTAWNSIDLLEDEHRLYCGRPGSVGTRGGNFAVQNSDLLLVLGCRLNIRAISYNYREFAKDAYKIVIDIDKAELQKPTIKVDMPIWADVKDVINSIIEKISKSDDRHIVGYHDKWISCCRKINENYPVVTPKSIVRNKPINPYVFISSLFHQLKEDEQVICGNGSACVMTFQAAEVKRGQRIFTNSGCAAMGYGFPAAIGAHIAGSNNRTICIDGDGSFQMNIQELQTLSYHNLNLKIFVINNNGYPELFMIMH